MAGPREAVREDRRQREQPRALLQNGGRNACEREADADGV
jgi:hypothetical protein